MTIGTIESPSLARSGRDYRALIESDADWIVRSTDDLDYLRAQEDSVFAKLSKPDYEAFTSSCKFKNRGLVTACYKPLMASLPLTEIFKVFEHFGISREYFTGKDLEFRCTGGGCKFDFWYFCSPDMC